MICSSSWYSSLLTIHFQIEFKANCFMRMYQWQKFGYDFLSGYPGIRQKVLLICSKNKNIFASAEPGRLPLLRYDYLDKRVYISISLVWLYKGFIYYYKNCRHFALQNILINQSSNFILIFIQLWSTSLLIPKMRLDLLKTQNYCRISLKNLKMLLKISIITYYKPKNILHILIKFYISKMLEQDNQIYEFSLTVKEIKLTVKFPCKLTLNYQAKTIKSDVSPNDAGKYLIQREVKAKSENGEPVEILIHLTTQKGGNIMAGVIKLNPKELACSQGQTLSVNLQKCLDQSANCLIKVDRVWLSRNSKAKSLIGDFSSRNRKNLGQDGIGSSKKLPPTIIDNYRNVETRSEFPGFNLKKPSVLKKQQPYDTYIQQNKMYGLGPKSYVPEAPYGKSRNFDRSIQYHKEGNRIKFQDDNKTVGKREVDPSYRLTVQANEKNLKMDIMKYKMKCEEHQKTIEQKTKQIKQLKQQISNLHRQSVQKNFYQQEISSKNQIIQKLEDTSKQLNKENNRLQSKVIELQRAAQQIKGNLQSVLQRTKDQKQRRQTEVQKQLALRKDEISLLNDDLKSKSNQIGRMKKIIEDLQKSLQGKTFDYEKSIQGQRTEMNKLENLLNDKIKQLQAFNKSINLQKQNLSNELQKKNQQVQKLEANTNNLLAQIKEVTELQKYYGTYKSKFGDLQKAHEKLDQEKKQVQKHYLKLLESKQKDLGDFKEQQSGLIGSYKKKNNQLTEKGKSQITKILQLQNKIALLASQVQKLRRNLDLAQRELSSLTQTEKLLTQTVKQKDESLLLKQKELSQLESKLSTRESLLRKDIEYKTQQLTKVSTRLAEQEHLYRQQKQQNQTFRFESTKLQGKIRLQQQIISRLNRQIEETKVSNDKKQNEYKQQMKQLNDKIKEYEQIEKKLNKQITEYEMQDLNRKNEINRLTKELEIKNQKLQRQTKRSQQLDQTVKQLNQVNKEIDFKFGQLQQDLKELQNNNKALEADFTKTEKIKTIIVEQKTSAQNQLLTLKKNLEVKAVKEQQLSKQIKQLKQQLAKATLKANNSSKDFENFKENLYNSIQSAFYSNNGKPIGKGFNISLDINKDFYQRTHQRANSSSTNLTQSISLLTSPRKLHESQVVVNSNEYNVYEPRFNQIIQTYGRESQQTIANLNDSVRKHKGQIQRLERQHSSLSARLQSTEQQASSAIMNLQKQIETVKAKHQQTNNQWQQKFMLSQRANRQKEQMIEQLNQELQSVNHQLAANTRTHQIQLEELGLKIQQLKAKIYDLEAKSDFSNMTVLNYQQKTFSLEATVCQLQQQLDFEREKVDRKDKLISQHTSRIDDLSKLLDENKKERFDLNKQLLTTKEKLDAQNESNQKYKKLLQEEEQKNKQIKGFNSNLLKEKETVVKNQIQKSERVIELQDLISRMKIEKTDLQAQIQIRQKSITQLKAQIKKLLSTIKQLENALDKENHQTHKLSEANREKQKRLQERDIQIKNLQISLQKLMSRYDQDLKKANQENQDSLAKFNKQLQQKKTKILELSNEIQKLNHLEKKITEQNVSLEEQIFFEKQTNSLASSRFQSINKDFVDLQSKLTQAVRQIDSLNEEVRDREEKLFDMSNKLYGLDSKLQMKEIQMRQKLQKLDSDWKNKYEQTLQDYEARLESFERQKQYLRVKLQEQMQDISKLQNEKRVHVIESETEKKVFDDKLKKVENEKLILLVEKNKQIQKLRQEIQSYEDRIKQTKMQKDIKEDDIRRLDEKLKEKQERLISQEDKSQQALAQLERELDFQKKKQSQLKKYKEFIKNNIWSSEREIKRILQSYVKNIMVLCEEEKKKDLMDIMKIVEGQIVKAIDFNLEQV